jgi:oxygen-dependent protoporphyrinogen oxidase
MGIRAEPVLCRINRFARAMPQYNVGHLERVRTIESLAGQVTGLYLAGAAYGGVGIPDCARSGERAAAAALDGIMQRNHLVTSPP